MRLPRKALLRAGCGLGLLLTLAGPAAAGGLEMELACQTRELAGSGRGLEVTVRNRGQETASSLQAVPMYPPGAAPSPTLASLAGGQSASLGLSWGQAETRPGLHCAVLRLDLRDQQQMPLSALGYVCQELGPDGASPLDVQAPPVELAGQGRLTASLRNQGAEPVSLTLRALVPRELAAWPPLRELTLAPGQTRQLSWRLENLSGQVGGRYPLLLLSGLDLSGRRLERVDEVMVTLAPLPNPFRAHLGWWLAALLGLAAWLGGAQWRARRK